jgi:hypothetical protein
MRTIASDVVFVHYMDFVHYCKAADPDLEMHSTTAITTTAHMHPSDASGSSALVRGTTDHANRPS